jgi:hypothetical protein
MKVWLSNYRNHWISPYTILKKVCFWEKDEDRIYNLKDEPDNTYEKWVNLLDPICQVIQKVLNFVHPRFNYVKLDQWDTWSMDHTLAYIIHPMLLQLKETKHGAPYTDDKDVPKELKSTSAPLKENEWDTDEFHFQRWDYILDEMIWAFEQELKDDDENQFFDHSAYDKPDGSKSNHKEWFDDMTKAQSKLKVNWKGLKEHQKRKANGFRLFGRYYQNLWD